MAIAPGMINGEQEQPEQLPPRAALPMWSDAALVMLSLCVWLQGADPQRC